MDEVKFSFDSDIGRGLICGVVLGVVLALVEIFLRRLIYPRYLIDFVFLIVVGLVSYRFVGSPVPGLILGVLTLIVQEIAGAFILGYIPFSWVQYMQYYWFAPEFLLPIAISYVGFPVVGFLGGYVYQRRSAPGAISSGNAQLSNLESRVFDYVRAHNNQIQITDCALELGVDSSSVKGALKSLEKKGKLKT